MKSLSISWMLAVAVTVIAIAIAINYAQVVLAELMFSTINL